MSARERLGLVAVAVVLAVGINARIDRDRVFGSDPVELAPASVVTPGVGLAVEAGAVAGILVGRGDIGPGACAEDDPCWDCATMGNLTCGPVGS
jgi:hypothetical protein